MLSVRCRHWLLLAASALLLFANSARATDEQAQLNTQERKVIDYLVGDWGQDFSVTSVDIAMAALKVEQSDETRFRIGSHIKAHPELHEVIRRWGWVTLVLTPEEKLIARSLINAEREGKPEPTIAEIAKGLGLSESRAKRGLAMLERYEILKQDAKAGGAGYRVIPHYIKWEPRLDFVYHRVTLDSGWQFNTN
jgi:hypothetical protein